MIVNCFMQDVIVKVCFYQRLLLLLCIFFAAPLFAHNGSHETKSCLVRVGEYSLRLSGYQFQGLHPDAAYCRVFPFLGTVLIKLEAIDNATSVKQVTLQLIKVNDFSLVKTATFNSFKEVVMLQNTVTERGLYALDIMLQTPQQQTTQRFYFLIGIPMTQILVIASMCLLLWLMAILLTQHRTKRAKNQLSNAADEK